MQGVQAIAKAAPATIGPPLPGPLEQGVDVPLAVEAGDEERGDEEHPHGDDQRRGDLGQQLLVVAEGRSRAPVAVSPTAMKIAEKLATKSRLGTRIRRQPAVSSSPAETPLTAER